MAEVVESQRLQWCAIEQDAARYISNLPNAVPDLPEWQAAMEALLLVAERGGPVMFARIGIMRAHNARRADHVVTSPGKRAKKSPVVR